MKQHILMYIQSYQQNIRSTEELEGHLAEEGVLLREYSGKGFMVIGDDTIFMIKLPDGVSLNHYVNTGI